MYICVILDAAATLQNIPLPSLLYDVSTSLRTLLKLRFECCFQMFLGLTKVSVCSSHYFARLRLNCDFPFRQQ